MSVVNVDTQELPVTPPSVKMVRKVEPYSSPSAPAVCRAARTEARREQLRQRYVLSVASLGTMGALLGITVLVLDMVR
jgi:hypothetical protein